jgi:two-component system, OmpR family, sensor histidine kinase KdpD
VSNEVVLDDKSFYGASNAIGGVGLGLTICIGVVQVRGGSIDAQNQPEGRAVFSSTLPFENKTPELKDEV